MPSLHSDTDIQWWIAQRPSSCNLTDRTVPSKHEFERLITGRVFETLAEIVGDNSPKSVLRSKTRPFRVNSDEIHQNVHVAFGTTFKIPRNTLVNNGRFPRHGDMTADNTKHRATITVPIADILHRHHRSENNRPNTDGNSIPQRVSVP